MSIFLLFALFPPGFLKEDLWGLSFACFELNVFLHVSLRLNFPYHDWIIIIIIYVHVSINGKIVIPAKLLWYKRTKTPQDALLLENNQRPSGDSNSFSPWAASHDPIIDYFPVTARPSRVLSFTYRATSHTYKLPVIMVSMTTSASLGCSERS